ncbi:MAG: ArnT family glycosyltransferase [Crocinitomicaceae bacterium]
MSFDYFTNEQLFPLLVGAVVLLVSLVFYSLPKTKKLGIPTLFLGALVLGYFVANLDHFLILWDEQYHALVAKNLIDSPLKPVLYSDPAFPCDHKIWTGNHVWLHKQPLFLWQMAISIKLFGVSELAIRIPSVLMHAIIPLFIYRIGTHVRNQNTGYFGAFLFTVAYFPLELVVGRYATDHNDIAFMFYLTASFWAWFEYQQSGKKYWILLIGLFSGGAVLVKWLMGMLIYVVWFLSKVIFEPDTRWKLKSYLPLAISGLLSMIIFIPWQIYALSNYPDEYLYEYERTNSHLWKAIEGHSESFFYHFTDGLNKLYGSGALVPIILLLALVLLITKMKNAKYKFVIVFSITFVYVLFTLAQTKMVAFPIIVAPFVFLALGHLLSSLFDFLSSKIRMKWLSTTICAITLLLFGFMNLNLDKIQNYHTDWKPHDNHKRAWEIAEMKSIRLIQENLNTDYVVFNTSVTYEGNIPTMFYTGITAYSFIPSEEQVQEVKRQNKKIAVLDLGNLPSYIHEDANIKVLDVRGILPN